MGSGQGALAASIFNARARYTGVDINRPLQDYVNGLADCGLMVDCVKEMPTHKVHTSGPRSKAENMANQEVPLFLGLCAVKIK